MKPYRIQSLFSGTLHLGEEKDGTQSLFYNRITTSPGQDEQEGVRVDDRDSRGAQGGGQ